MAVDFWKKEHVQGAEEIKGMTGLGALKLGCI